MGMFLKKSLLVGAVLLIAVSLLASSAMANEEKEGKNPVVLIKTNLGNIKVELFEKEAPVSVKNFLWYVENQFYDGLIFHRVIPDFMIQGGGFNDKMKRKEGNAPIVNEATNGLKNDRGTLAMARTSVINSATSQFFINLKDNEPLNHRSKTPNGYGYAVFGKVIDGMDVVDEIAGVNTHSQNGYNDVPVNPVVIKSATIQGKKK